jgi:hypothetical protein
MLWTGAFSMLENIVLHGTNWIMGPVDLDLGRASV